MEEKFGPEHGPNVAGGDHREQDAQLAGSQSEYKEQRGQEVARDAGRELPVLKHGAQVNLQPFGPRLKSHRAQAADKRAETDPCHRGKRRVHLRAPTPMTATPAVITQIPT